MHESIFLTKSKNNNVFYWPQVSDRDNVEVKVVKEGRKYKVLNLLLVFTMDFPNNISSVFVVE